jgi:hypothetical protein
MKNLNTILTLICFCFAISLSSCDKDDDGLNDEQILANEQNAAEDRKIPTTELEKNVKIVGANFIVGTAPAPTGSVDFKLQGSNDRAQLKTGFNIKLESSDDNIAGAYIQLLDTDKNKVNGYLQVPKSAFTYGRLKGEESKGIFGLRTKELDENEIDINFEDGLEPGTFCYEICLYDADSNVSTIQEVCVEVESWGGNADLVGTWKFNEAESDLEDISFEDYYKYCNNGDSILIEYMAIYEDVTITFDNKGNYEEGGIVNFPNAVFSAENCSVIYEDDDSEKASGRWSFNEDNQTLVVVTFIYIYPNNDIEEIENGELYFENDAVSIINNKLTITFLPDDEEEIGRLIYVFDKQ